MTYTVSSGTLNPTQLNSEPSSASDSIYFIDGRERSTDFYCFVLYYPGLLAVSPQVTLSLARQ